MRRGKQSIFFLLLIILCAGGSFWRQGLYFTEEGAFHSVETGLRYGPSEEILLTYDREDGSQIIVGRWNDGLSVVPVERYLGLFWRMPLGTYVEGYQSMRYDVDGLVTAENWILGLSRIPEVSEVDCLVVVYDEEERKEVIAAEATLPVNEEGFFCQKLDLELVEPTDYGYSISYLEGRTADGDVVFRHGTDKTGNFFQGTGDRFSEVRIGGEGETWVRVQ